MPVVILTKTVPGSGNFVAQPGIGFTTISAKGAGGEGEDDSAVGGEGGGGGAAAEGVVALVGLANYSWTVGLGGGLGSGPNGGDTQFGNNLVKAVGGLGGVNGGSGGAAANCVGAITSTGGGGGTGDSGGGGGGGSGADFGAANGNMGDNATPFSPGNGGAAVGTSGAGGDGGAPFNFGFPGGTPGGGGGGTNNGTPGIGGDGYLVISYNVPQVITFGGPAPGNYVTSQILQFAVRYDEAVTVTGTPFLDLSIGGTDVQADYVSGSGTDTLTFEYTIQSGDYGDWCELVGLIDENGGSILNSMGNKYNGTLYFTPPTLSGVTVN